MNEILTGIAEDNNMNVSQLVVVLLCAAGMYFPPEGSKIKVISAIICAIVVLPIVYSITGDMVTFLMVMSGITAGVMFYNCNVKAAVAFAALAFIFAMCGGVKIG